VLSGWRHPRLP